MPVDRTIAASLVSETAEVYAELERHLIEQVGRRLAAGIDSDGWHTSKMLASGEVRRWADGAVQRVNGPAGARVARELGAAYRAGGDAALAELATVGANLRQVQQALPNAPAVNRLISTTVDKLASTRLPILRTVEDIYRQTISRVGVPSVLAGAQTRRQAAQQVYSRLTQNGITGFVDQSGRGWSLPGYVDMATRTATAQAAVEGHLDRLADAGLDLVIVSNASGECEKCRPWEGRVLTRGGAGGRRTIERESEISDDIVKIEVAGSVAEATAAGLLHPNCRHSLSAYLPGVTPPIRNTEDPQGDKDRQRLRALERRKRDLLRQEAALKPFNGDKTPPVLKAKIADVNGAIKAHVASTDLRRQPARERIDLGLVDHGRRKVPVPAEVAPVRADPAPAMIHTLKDRLAGGVVDSRPLGGLSAKTEMLTLKDGSKVIRKAASERRSGMPEVDQTDAEELGAMVARAVGVRVPEVYRKSKNTVYMEFMEGDVADALPESVVAALRSGPAGKRLGLADLLMGNTDRNGGNLLIHNGEITAIDHGAAFQWHPSLNAPGKAPYIGNDYWRDFVSEGTEQWLDNPLTPSDVAELRRRLEALKPEFDRLKREDWYRNSMTRLDALGQHATGKTGLIT